MSECEYTRAAHNGPAAWRRCSSSTKVSTITSSPSFSLDCCACFEYNSTSWWTSLKMNFIEFEKRAAWERCALKSSRWLYELCCCGWLPGRCEELALIPTLGEHFFSVYPFFFFYLPLYPLLSKQRWLKGNVFRGEVECKHFRDEVECEHFSEFRIHEKCRFGQNSWKIWIMNCDFEEVLFQTSPDYY